MAWNDAVITNKGIQMIASLVSGEKITITKAVIGSATVAAASLMSQTAISSVISAPVGIAEKSKSEDGKALNVLLQIRNSGVNATARMRQIGLFAKTETSAEVLFAIMQDSTGEEIPRAADYPDFLIEFMAAIAVSNAEDFSVAIDSSVFVTLEKLQEHTADSTAHITAADREKWDGKANKSEIPTSLPANGGNADTVDSKHASEFADKVLITSYTQETIPAGSDICAWMLANGKTNVRYASVGGQEYTNMPDSGAGTSVWRWYWWENAIDLMCQEQSTKKTFQNRYVGDGKNAAYFYGWINVADAGNADTVDGKHASDFVPSYVNVNWSDTNTTILSWANTQTTSAYAFIVNNNLPTDIPPIYAEWFLQCFVDPFNARKTVTAIPYNPNTKGIYRREIWGGEWRDDWHNIADGGDADTINGKTAADFLPITGGTLTGNLVINNGSDIHLEMIPWTDGVHIRSSNGTDLNDIVLDLNACRSSSAFALQRSGFGYWVKDVSGNDVIAVTQDLANNGCLFTNGGYNLLAIGNPVLPTFIRGSETVVQSNSWTGNSQVRNLSSGTAAATTANCPAGAWYGQHG